MGLGKAVVSSLVTGAAFAAEAHLFHQLAHVPLPLSRYLLYVGLAGGLYSALRLRKALAQASALLVAALCGVLSCHGAPCNKTAAALALLVVALYPGRLRKGPFRKPLSITLAWLLGLAALTPHPPLPLLATQALLLFALTLPYDVATQDTDTIPTLPRQYGEKLTYWTYQVALGSYAGWSWFLLPALRLPTLLTALVAGALVSWKRSLRWPYLLLYDGLLVGQAALAALL
ncbi:MAG: hypothetical protein KatS3mg026_0441 [Bacteroidia bacterium]|nr:MAG: hypothetical protein KatS3mg026_0441 [Bacteroidia bacterium]